MARFLPSSSEPADDADPRVVGVDSDDAGELLAALSSETARAILASLHDEPAAPSEVATRVDTTLQNAQYHIAKLEDADMIHVADTVYSEKGREMSVYAPSDRPLVMFAGPDEETTGLRAALSRLLGGVGVLGIAAAVIDRVARDPPSFGFASPGGDSAAPPAATRSESEGAGESGNAASGSETTVEETTRAVADGAAETTAEATRTATDLAADKGGDATAVALEATTEVANAGGFDPSPGLLFFAGGLTMLVVVLAFRYARSD